MRPPPKIKKPKLKKPKKEPKSKKKKDQGDDDTKGDKTFRCSVKTGEIRRSSRNAGKEKKDTRTVAKAKTTTTTRTTTTRTTKARQSSPWVLGSNHAHANRRTCGYLPVWPRRWLRNLVPNPPQPRSTGHVPVHQATSERRQLVKLAFENIAGVFG